MLGGGREKLTLSSRERFCFEVVGAEVTAFAVPLKLQAKATRQLRKFPRPIAVSNPESRELNTSVAMLLFPEVRALQ